MTDLKYKINSFDEVERLLEIEFEDGSKAILKLNPPFPNTLEQLEAAIKPLAPSIAELEARTIPTNFNFIHEILGKDMVTTRLDNRLPIPPVPALPPADIAQPADLIVSKTV